MAYHNQLSVDCCENMVRFSIRVSENHIQSFSVDNSVFLEFCRKDFFENNKIKIKCSPEKDLVKISLKSEPVSYSYHLLYSEWKKNCSIAKSFIS